jgi:ribosome-binding factor A
MSREFTAENKERRQKKLTQVLREEVALILRQEVKDPRLDLLTITEVALKPDLKSALIYVSPLSASDEVPPEAEREEVLKGLRSASHFIYERLKKRLSLKVIPSIKFQYDLRFLKASKVWHIMGEMT